MAIDISQDLNIVVTQISMETKTLTGIYDTGSPPDTYLPGKDFSATDAVSTGAVTSYKIGVALSSKSNQSYPIDKLFLQSVDDPKSNGTGAIPIVWINTDPNPENITDNGLNTPTGRNADMTSVVLDGNSGVTSTSTVQLTLNVNYGGIQWKTKLLPNIVAVAQKDGIEKKSEEFHPTEVKLSSKAIFNSNLSINNQEFDAIRLGERYGVKGFWVPIYLESMKQNMSGISRLLDAAVFGSVIYHANLSLSLDGAAVNLTSVETELYQIPTGYAWQQTSLSANLIEIKLNKTDPTADVMPRVRVNIFIPFDPGTKTQVTLAATGSWATAYDNGVTLDAWQNQYLFDKTQTGGFNRSVVIPLVFQNLLTLNDYVSGSYRANNSDLTAYFATQFNDFISISGSKFMVFLDSKVCNISDSPPFLRINYKDSGVNQNYDPPQSDYLMQYGYVDFSVPYDANTVAQSIMMGGVTMGTYADILAMGHKPNVLMTTVLSDILAGLSIDDGSMRIFYEGHTLIPIPPVEFKTLYDANPTATFPTYLYTGILLGTNFATVADANAKYGSLLASSDSFRLQNGKVMLYLSTRNPGQSATVARFRTNSTVRADIAVPKLTAEFTTAVADNNLNPISDIFDYSQTYSLKYFVSRIAQPTTGWGTIRQGTDILLHVPTDVLPNLYIAGTPKIMRFESNMPVLVAPISDFALTPQGIRLTMPQDQYFFLEYYIDVPVRFLLPANSKVFSHSPTTIDEAAFFLTNPAEITVGFPASTVYFDVRNTYYNTTLNGAGVDFTGLAVNKVYYENGTGVTYMASVKNEVNGPTDLYQSMTVPANLYNPLESSNNSLPAFITGITALYPTTELYYQTAALATPMDIEAMKLINQPGTNLGFYFDNVITLNWTQYHNGDPLPADVVMLATRTRGVPQGAVVRVDYNVKVQVPTSAPAGYRNDAAVNYYSSASTLESQSNKVSIYNFPLENKIAITKAPATQSVKGSFGQTAAFDLTFAVPAEALGYDSLVFTDTLPPALSLSAADSTLKIGSDAATALNATLAGNTVVKDLTPMLAQIAGKTVTIHLGVTVFSVDQIPTNLKDENRGALTINGNPALVATSNVVEILYYFDDLYHIRKEPLTQSHPKTLGEPVEFRVYFDIPADTAGLGYLVIEDVLPDALQYDPANSLLQIGTDIVEPLNATVDGQKITVFFTRIAEAAGKTVRLTIGTTLHDLAALPTDGVVRNQAKLMVNGIPAAAFLSNWVIATFGAVMVGIPIQKSPTSQRVQELVGTAITFKLSFKLPTSLVGYESITVTDPLHLSLRYNLASSTIQFGAALPAPLEATISGNELVVELTELDGHEGQTVVITLSAQVADLSKIPFNKQIVNNAQLMVNHSEALRTQSNDAMVIFITYKPNPRCQAITDLIESVAMEQTAIGTILEGEKMKLHRAIEIGATHQELLAINASIQSTVDSITLLEHVLKEKLETVICDGCQDCNANSQK